MEFHFLDFGGKVLPITNQLYVVSQALPTSPQHVPTSCTCIKHFVPKPTVEFLWICLSALMKFQGHVSICSETEIVVEHIQRELIGHQGLIADSVSVTAFVETSMFHLSNCTTWPSST